MGIRTPLKELPTHCFDCGVYLEGGATRHKASCAIKRMIEEAVGKESGTTVIAQAMANLRTKALSPKRRSEIASAAAKKRWAKKKTSGQ